MRIAKTAASEIDGDEFTISESDRSQGFKNVYDQLSTHKSNKSLSYIYTLKKTGEENIVFVVDTDEVDPGKLFEPYEWRESMAPAFNGGVSSDDDFYTDEWGTYLSGYAPIVDSKSQVTGIVACDISKNTINERIERFRILIVVLGLISNAFLVIMLRS